MMTSYEANSMRVQVQTEAAGFLVLSEVWYPGWRAAVNGKVTPVQRANGALRAVAVPAGEATVELWFAPRSWRIGLTLFGIGVLCICGVFVLKR
ncbi:YfhO family protein [Chloroflexi bacterium TSY]|nr:YfhO family protein [Chloroflexi bacterium TSY]